MTYNTAIKSYNFTAFAEADLLKVGDTAMSAGDKFVMPAKATTSITVTDDDAHLSGDSWYNGHADDTSHQTAEISGRSSTGQIYAEVYHWVYDASGKWYMLVEVKQEGSSESFFTFHAQYGVPAAGASLTVHSTCDIKSSGWCPDYVSLGAGHYQPPVDTGTISGTVFCDVDCDGINGEIETIPGKSYTIEAESMTKCNFVTDHGSQASGGQFVKLTTTAYHGWDGYLQSTFQGVSGKYDLKIRVQDENDGQSIIYVVIDGVTVKAVKLDRDSDGEGSNHGSFSTFVVEDVDIKAHSQVMLKVDGNGSEFVRIDKIDFHGEPTTKVVTEPVKDGVTIKLLNAAGEVVDTTTTDHNGNYKFTDVPVGEYKIMGVAPDGTEFTIKDAGNNDNIDSDVGADGTSDTVTVVKGGNVDIDLGVCEIEVGKISGTVFCDVDCDGINGSVQTVPGKSYVIEAESMTLCNFKVVSGVEASGGKLVTLTTTSYSGWDGYLLTSFKGDAGKYDLKIHVQDENDGQSIIYVVIDGVTVKAVKLDRDSDGAGSNNGKFSTFVVEDVSVKANSQIMLKVDGNKSEFVRIDKIEFTGEPTTKVVTEPVKEGVTIKLLTEAGVLVETTTTDANGNYEFDNVPAGKYKIMGVAPDGTEFTIKDAGNNDNIDSDVGADGMSDVVTVVKDGHIDIDLGVCEKPEPASIAGRVFHDGNDNSLQDAGEVGVAMVTVELLNAAGEVVATAQTNDMGDYIFNDLDAGTYTVRFPITVDGKVLVEQDVNNNGNDTIDSDANQTTGQTGPITVAPGDEVKNVDAGIEDPMDAVISGRYFVDDNDNSLQDAGEAGVANALVILFDQNGDEVARQLTGNNGEYSFSGLKAGTYSVFFTEDVSGRVFVEQDVNGNGNDTIDSDVDQNTGRTGPIVLEAGGVSENNDAGVEDPNASEIAGRFFVDENDNSLDDAGDGSVPLATVILLDENGDEVARQQTAPDGTYRFTGLPAGTYSVLFENPTDLEFVEQDVNGNANDADDSDVDPVTGQTGPIVLGINDVSENNDAGVEDPGTASVGDIVFVDANENGIRDAGELGLDGVTVKLLTDADGDGQVDDVIAETTTTNGGQYLFDNLDAGDYAVMFNEPAGFNFTTPGLAPDDLISDDSDAGPNGMTEVFTLDVGEAERDIDAGVVLENVDPMPMNDALKTCADEVATADVLANDLPGAADLTITAINGTAISEGQSVTTAAGTIVTLSGGVLLIDGEAAYASLDIGAMEVENITYTVEDSNGAIADANLEVTFCGDANSVESFYNSLPTNVLYQLQYAADFASPFEDYAFDMFLTAPGDERFDNTFIAEVYCIDFNTAVRTLLESPGFNVGQTFGAQSASAFAAFDPNTVSNDNGRPGAENLALINWIIAQDFEAQGFSGWEVQFAIWELADNFNSSLVQYQNFQNTELADVQFILDQATVSSIDPVTGEEIFLNDSFQFSVGDQISLIIDPGNTDPQNVQDFIIALDWETFDCLC